MNADLRGANAARGAHQVPSAPLFFPTTNTRVQSIDARELLAEGRVVVFALPGAFTPTCTSEHLPRFEELAELFFRNGIDRIVCIAVNDPYVMAEWGAQQQVRAVTLISDGNGSFAEAMGMRVDHRDLGMGLRSRRYSMLVENGRIQKLFVEADAVGDPYGVSDADTMLDYLAPAMPRPPRIVLFTRPGCPYCSKAIRLLEDRGLSYREFPLKDAERSRVLSAVAKATTTPQVFIDGRLIGGSDALQRHLEQEAEHAGF